MPPEKNLTVEEGGEIKESLDFLTAEVSAIKEQQKTILNLVMEAPLVTSKLGRFRLGRR